MTPFELDTSVKQMAEREGLNIAGRWRIDIDQKELPEQYWKRQPDFRAIRAAVVAGQQIPGVKLADWEYVLTKGTMEEKVGNENQNRS